MSEWLVLSAAGPGRCDGIGDYSWHLTQALSRLATLRAEPATLVVRQESDRPPETPHDAGSRIEYVSSWTDLGAPEWITRARNAKGVFVQYFPQAFAQPDLSALLAWLAARRRAQRPVVMTVHEYWPPASLSPKRMVTRFLYRRALRRLVAQSSLVIVSQPYAARELAASGIVPAAELRVIPIGSGVPRVNEPKANDDPTLVMFGQPAALDAKAVGAVARWIARVPKRPRFWWFSRSEVEMRAWWRERISAPDDVVTFHGGLSATTLSRRLLEGTVALAPYVDGASTRRSSLAALLEHGLPLVALDGRYTDDLLRRSGAFVFVPRDDSARMSDEVASLLADRARRTTMAAAAHGLFAEHLSWPRIAQAYLTVLEGTT